MAVLSENCRAATATARTVQALSKVNSCFDLTGSQCAAPRADFRLRQMDRDNLEGLRNTSVFLKASGAA
jgi:hypothetical protein